MFIAALFTIVKIWKQPKCPSIDEWIKKLWDVYAHTHAHIYIFKLMPEYFNFLVLL